MLASSLELTIELLTAQLDDTQFERDDLFDDELCGAEDNDRF